MFDEVQGSIGKACIGLCLGSDHGEVGRCLFSTDSVGNVPVSLLGELKFTLFYLSKNISVILFLAEAIL